MGRTRIENKYKVIEGCTYKGENGVIVKCTKLIGNHDFKGILILVPRDIDRDSYENALFTNDANFWTNIDYL